MLNFLQSKKQDHLAVELKKLERVRAALEEESYELERKLRSPYGGPKNARFAQTKHEQTALQPQEQFVNSPSELKIQRRYARNRFLLLCLVLGMLALLVYRTIF